MSFNVVVLPEDSTYDQHILRPLIQAMAKALGKPNARVKIYDGFGGFGDLLKWDNIANAIDFHRGIADAFVIVVDRDGNEGRRASLDGIERAAAGHLPPDKRLFGENAHQEVEVWLLAGHDLPADWDWPEIRGERDSKERFFEPWLAHHASTTELETLGRQAAQNYDRVRRLCPEVASLEDRLRAWLETR